MRIVFLLTHIPNPRFNKRIQEISQWADVYVICARRINMDIYPLKEIEGVQYHIININIPPAVSIFGRFQASVKFGIFARKQLKMIYPNVIYFNGIEGLFFAFQACKNAKICYEIADLREYSTSKYPITSIRGIVDRTIRTIEKKLSNRISLLVVTSRRFYDVYYSLFMSKDKLVEIPNMPIVSAFENYRPKESGNFTVGFVGGLRYLNQMRMLVDAAGDVGVDVVFSGATDLDSDGSFRQYCVNKPWVKFTGRYNFQTEIAEIYGNIDCVYSVYDASNFNVRIALPNKLYEAVICHLPIIVAKDTYLSELVSEWGVGVSVGYDNKQELVEVLSRLKKKDGYYKRFVERCIENEDKIDAQKYLDNLSNRIKLLNNAD